MFFVRCLLTKKHLTKRFALFHICFITKVLDLEWMFGNMIMGGVAMYLRDWRAVHVAMSVPSLVILPLLWFVTPESPSWLITAVGLDLNLIAEGYTHANGEAL